MLSYEEEKGKAKDTEEAGGDETPEGGDDSEEGDDEGGEDVFDF